MIDGASDEMGAQTVIQLLQKTYNKDRPSVSDNGLQDAMIADNV
jgi:hypothetical protein